MAASWLERVLAVECANHAVPAPPGMTCFSSGTVCASRIQAAEEAAPFGEVEPYLLSEDRKRLLRPRLEALAARLCQTQGLILGALKQAGLTVVPLLDEAPGAAASPGRRP